MENRNYVEELTSLERDVYNNMGNTPQIVIDMVQDVRREFARDQDESPITSDELGAAGYNIDVLLEVFNPELEYGIEVLKNLNRIVSDWENDV